MDNEMKNTLQDWQIEILKMISSKGRLVLYLPRKSGRIALAKLIQEIEKEINP